MNRTLFSLLLGACFGSFLAAANAESLQEGFQNPPDSARPQVWWDWMNGNVTREGITADLEAMKRVGIGGATIISISGGIPAGPVKFNSPEWRGMVKFAAQEASRLGLEIGVSNCAGWSSSGGPWNTPEHGMQTVVTSETHVSGPAHFEGKLPQPPSKLGFYRDIAVLAFPAAASSEEARIGDWQAKAFYKRGKIRPGESATGTGAAAQNQVLDVSAAMKPDGTFAWEVPQGKWTILRVGHTPTGKKNHPAPPEGAGLECDKLSKEAATAHWEGYMGKLIAELGPLTGKAFNGVLIDSYEVGTQNWTPLFREEFKRRRGYDLGPFLPTLTGRAVESPEVSERFLWDFRRTIADLFAENYSGAFAELAHRSGLSYSVEPYGGSPSDDIQYGSYADIPMGEFMALKPGSPYESVALASSVAHVYGRKIAGAEAFTSGSENSKWLTDPAALKAQGDTVFAAGINRLIFHRYAHQPWLNRYPGMTMGQWGIQFERTLTWWNEGAAWMRYLARCQSLLQSGRFVADALFFNGEGAPSERLQGKMPAGYASDSCDIGALLRRVSVKDGRLVLPDGMSYRLLVLPTPGTAMTPEALRKIKELAGAGAAIIGPRPVCSPSLAGYPACDEEVRRLASELWDQKKVVDEPVAAALRRLNLKPDFEAAPALRYIHRNVDGAEVYFISNPTSGIVETEALFRVAGKAPELWNPETGQTAMAPVYTEKEGRTSVALWLPPSGATFVVFRGPAPADHAVTERMPRVLPPASGSALEIPLPAGELSVRDGGQLRVEAWQPGVFEVTTAGGRTLRARVENLPAASEVTGSWSLRFPPHWGAPAQVTLPKLISWTDSPDKGVKYFSGTAMYDKTLTIPAALLGKDRSLYLDLGKVKNLARVRLNGADLGVLWKPPFRVNITACAKPGENRLEVEVTNLWPNRLIGDEQLPEDRVWQKNGSLKEWPKWLLEGKPSPTGRYIFTTWHFWSRDDQLLESGILGPVRLLPSVHVALQ